MMRKSLNVLIIGIVLLAFASVSHATNCAYLSDDFATNSGRWVYKNGSWAIKGGKLNVSNIQSNALAYAETSIAPKGAFFIDVDMEQLSVNQTNGASGLYFFTEGTTYVNINNNNYDGFAVFVYAGGLLEIVGYNVQ